MTTHDPRYVVAIDGPAASGKSTTAARVADRLGFVHLNSGLLYRAFTWRTLADGRDEEAPEYAEWVDSVRISFESREAGIAVVVDGQVPGDALFGQDVATRVSSVAAQGAVRDAVFERLRAAAIELNLVCDGRDIGTTVFPDADLKIFLVAEPAERARRRLADLGVEPDPAGVREEAERLVRRDRADSTRAISPLRRAVDAIEIDTTTLNPELVVDRIVDLALERGIGGAKNV